MRWTWSGRRMAASAVLAAALAVTAACADVNGRLYVRIGPPSPVYETRFESPGPGYIWIGGYHRWDGRGYIWVPGRWERPPRARAVWIPGHWDRDRRGYFFVDGHWRY